MLEKIERFQKNSNIADAADVLPDDDEDDEEFLINRAKNPYHLKELDCTRWKQDITQDKQTLTAASEKVKSITPERDGKLKEIKKHISRQGAKTLRKIRTETLIASYSSLRLSRIRQNISMITCLNSHRN